MNRCQKQPHTDFTTVSHANLPHIHEGKTILASFCYRPLSRDPITTYNSRNCTTFRSMRCNPYLKTPSDFNTFHLFIPLTEEWINWNLRISNIRVSLREMSHRKSEMQVQRTSMCIHFRVWLDSQYECEGDWETFFSTGSRIVGIIHPTKTWWFTDEPWPVIQYSAKWIVWYEWRRN